MKRFGVAHVSEIYEGDHVNHIEERLRTKVVTSGYHTAAHWFGSPSIS